MRTYYWFSRSRTDYWFSGSRTVFRFSGSRTVFWFSGSGDGSGAAGKRPLRTHRFGRFGWFEIREKLRGTVFLRGLRYTRPTKQQECQMPPIIKVCLLYCLSLNKSFGIRKSKMTRGELRNFYFGHVGVSSQSIFVSFAFFVVIYYLLSFVTLCPANFARSISGCSLSTHPAWCCGGSGSTGSVSGTNFRSEEIQRGTIYNTISIN